MGFEAQTFPATDKGLSIRYSRFLHNRLTGSSFAFYLVTINFVVTEVTKVTTLYFVACSGNL